MLLTGMLVEEDLAVEDLLVFPQINPCNVSSVVTV